MKVETPQILWNSEGDKNVNAALLSLALLDVSSPSAGEEEGSVSILATAGTSASINLWNNLKFQCSLTRQDGSCNCVRFSPNGLHLAAACEQALVVWSVPSAGVPGREHWLTVTREQDLQFKVVARSGEAFMDLAWSPDSSRIVVGSIDHTVVVCEYLPDQGAGSWRTLCRNECHSHFVQGVAYDPLNLYVASMSSDRTVRVHGGGAKSRPSKKGRKAAAASAALPPPALTASKENAELQASAGSISAGASATNVPGTLLPAVVTSAGSASGAPAAFAVAAADSRKLEMTKSKLIKYHRMAAPPDENGNQPGQQIQKHLYQDEASLESFVRRLSFTSDGAFLVTPAAQWWSSTTTNPASPEAAMPPPPMPQPQNATLVFSRHKWDEPCRILVGAHKVRSKWLLETRK
jgi:chromatin assembly factor 1 subunit B